MMEKRTYKDKAYQILTQSIKAISNPHRLEVLDLLANGEKSVEMIASETGMSIANTSQHLQVLKSVDLVKIRKAGNHIFYGLPDRNIYYAWKSFKVFTLDNNPEIKNLIQNFRNTRSVGSTVRLEEIFVENYESYLLLDVRPSDEFQAGHLPNALSIPIDQLEAQLDKIDPNREIVVYCRGTLCVFADEAVKMLKSKGYKAFRLEEGYADWEVQTKTKNQKL